ncbi:MAG: hypothetical protein [Circular genetic element sp.]|nr:MAG: hypothetical protein [Circular genetic element sp.]
MAKEAIGANAIFSGPQLGLTTIGSKVYAYSGNVIINNTTTDLLTFNTGKHILEVKIYWYGDFGYIGGAKVITEFVQFNGISVYDNSRLINSSSGDGSNEYGDPVPFLIPPFTLVNVQLGNDNAGDIEYGANVIGNIVE